MKRMLFNATNAEELRVAIVDGQKLIDLDIETAGREQRKGNIYKGVITRIEPSLEACFVNYGEERHGFLPFKEVERSYFKAGVDARNVSIKDALSEGQEIIVQVEKEERGNKGAALTTFVSLAGRYLVLMPNNPRGGGVSRRIEGEDRNELREAMSQLEIPQGMSIIARTAGIGRSAEELKWDLDHSLRLWNAIAGAAEPSLDEKGKRENPAPFLIYLESSLVIRAIRDYYQPDIGEILIDTPEIFEQTQSFMGAVMPHNVHRVKLYTDDIPLYSRFQIEHQIETAYARTVPLPSGGAIVIDHTEALVSVDVNSARATRGSDIEDTAYRTNLEAAEEVARQLRLRDLGGLIVIDFIDMESSKNQKDVESRLKEALHYDRARVQMGKISRFGLMELSRQRLRPSLSEGSHTTCPRCNGTGVIRDIESSALHVLRIIQEEAMKEHTAALNVQIPVDVATFLLNEKRAEIHILESRTKTNIILIPNKYLETPHYKLDRMRHDDERLELVQASYAQVDKPAEEVEYNLKETLTPAPRQEAAVKGILPTSPAPTPVERAPVATAQAVIITEPKKVGFWARLKAFFFGAPAPVLEEVVEAPAPKPLARASNNRNAHNNRSRTEDRAQRGDRRRQRNDRTDKTEPKAEQKTERPVKADGATDTAEQKPRQERRPRPERTERKDNDAQRTEPQAPEARVNESKDGEVREPREPRERRPRNNRNERKDTAEVKASSEGGAVTVAAPASTVFAVEVEKTVKPAENVMTDEAAAAAGEAVEGQAVATGERRERRSRGGRDRRERRERRESREQNGQASPEMNATANTISQLMRDDAPVLDHTPITIEIPAHVPVAGATFVVDAAPVVAPASIAPAVAVEPAPVVAVEAVVAEVAEVVVATESLVGHVEPMVETPVVETPVVERSPVEVTFVSEPAQVVAEAQAVPAAPAVPVVVPVEAVVHEVQAIEPIPVVETAVVVASTDAPAVADVPVEVIDAPLEAALSQVGLEMVQTSSDAVVPYVMTAPVRNHPPRERKPRSTVADEPLQLVETDQTVV
ncbi:Ribonuclease E [Ephemeroptericola cinctiostellae]|uniref:Ribonuclease E n=1 Tax=Ephemeroptericola cinctiostellae TaxID=2268024 RepID=A0A345D8F0_9BURK|nr:Rne/Rng family ribonuclease [Ephemeroptericola cinctiostellae]AXF84638.1 Ribonuclease E [Ephemeroptericola cinctiostellae]